MGVLLLLDEPFHLPAQHSRLEALFGEYDYKRRRITEIAALFQDAERRRIVEYFFDGNRTADGHRYNSSTTAEKIFLEQGAIAALNADFWSRALELTDVYQVMPQDRRRQWDTMVHERQTPEFERETVVNTLKDLLAARTRFFAERVDGIFRNLSGEHVTNSPMAFGKRMIIARLVSSYGFTNHDRVGYINDLRAVIARFMGQEEPRWNSSSRIVEFARRERRGQWVTLDGGALRLRAYKCGTAHLEVHPEMAWRLNAVLSSIYPDAIPASARTKPKKTPPNVSMLQRPLPFAVIELLAEMEPACHRDLDERGSRPASVAMPNTLQFRYISSADKRVVAEAEDVLAAIGGVKQKGYFRFDYDPRQVLMDIVCSGCIPDRQAHQFYPTPSAIAARIRAIADIQAGQRVLEPSAGRGDLIDGLPREVVQCVEVSGLHASILETKGYAVDREDFLTWSERHRHTYEVVLMNPPFSEGRWQAHLTAAAGCVKPGGRLVAVLPASARGKPVLPNG